MNTEIVSAIDGEDRRSAASAELRQGRRTAATGKAVELLRAGEVVALPTETVYGLAANALRPEAVVKIFEAKERPRFDPLIVHLPDIDWLERVANIPAEEKELVSNLAGAFWSGPFTMILPKTDLVPDIVTAGLNTVAVRISAHPIFQEVIRAFGKPLAAPSANRFGRISPTTAEHVLDELSGRIPLIVDGGPTAHGMESTIVAVRNGKIEIVRPGPITQEQLSGIGFQPMNPEAEISVAQGAHLPHWRQSDVTYAVTFRLADSLPGDVVEQWKRQRLSILANSHQQNRELSPDERQTLSKLFSERIDTFLDRGNGECWLSRPLIATLVRNALLHFDRERYNLVAWCIMPNHVHVMVQPHAGFQLSEILHAWKSFTAQRANKLLDRTGPFWQVESYDHVVRDEQDLQNQIRYLEQNPEKAGLPDWAWVSRGNSARWDHRLEADATSLRAPGQLPSHYAPSTSLRIIDSLTDFVIEPDQGVGLLAWNKIENPERFSAVRYLSSKQDPGEAATNLFRYLRELDHANVDLILAELVPEHGLGVAINDRLRRAATK